MGSDGGRLVAPSVAAGLGRQARARPVPPVRTFLGELPLTLAIRELADAGSPIVAARPDSEEAASYRAIAARLWAKLEGGGAAAAAGPRIVVE